MIPENQRLVWQFSRNHRELFADLMRKWSLNSYLHKHGGCVWVGKLKRKTAPWVWYIILLQAIISDLDVKYVTLNTSCSRKLIWFIMFCRKIYKETLNFLEMFNKSKCLLVYPKCSKWFWWELILWLILIIFISIFLPWSLCLSWNMVCWKYRTCYTCGARFINNNNYAE